MIKDDEKETIFVWDNFGKMHKIDAIKQEKIKEIIGSLDIYDVVSRAYGAYIPGMAEGRCMVDIEDGKINTGTYIGNTEDIFQPYIVLYTVPANLDLPTDEILSKKERKILKNKYEGDWDGFVRGEEIEIDERTIEALCSYVLDNRNEYWNNINEQLEDLYKKSIFEEEQE